MTSRPVVLLLAGFAALASGCVEEQPVYRPRPVVQREVVVERPVVRREVVEVVAPQAPPPRIVEVLPGPRPGYVWVHGYWRWDGARYVAVAGHWRPARPGYHYVHPHWEQRGDGWHFHVGVWVAD
ncbi:hypothetical protein QMK61_03645 [Fulvimonas sp. R45]|uniref:hypothetical protein n=1 Tax=Fulvimonas sp. R45 TaxID=3045937 RepID=UPI00265E8950|nr:hypothetical protein [Fulvimonas sp. R45]MDO1527917.1 hypothetical protein [Fulvimonas sp. R45]